jgi:hypothetical protein
VSFVGGDVKKPDVADLDLFLFAFFVVFIESHSIAFCYGCILVLFGLRRA